MENRSTKTNNRAKGTQYEAISAVWLEKKGYTIIDKNYRCRIGEIDLIAKDASYLVFIEVKYRRTMAQGAPYEAVDAHKQMKLRQCAKWYMAVNKLPVTTPVRFDVISICGDDIEHYENAFF